MQISRKMREQPFKPFRIKLETNRAIDVMNPWMALVGKDNAVVATETACDARGIRYALNWQTIPIAQMVEFSKIM